MATNENIDNPPPPQVTLDVTDEEEFVVITEPQENGESTVKIPKMEAICEICYTLLQEKNIVLKTKCKCEFSLIHQECYNKNLKEKENAKCEFCQGDIQYIPVILSMARGKSLEESTPPRRGRSWLRKKVFG